MGLAAGMGLNAFFTYTIGEAGSSWQIALSAIHYSYHQVCLPVG
jgi:xanthine/uracil/vitamin C permease (AzgA family)